jgi:hypothetical protein
MKTLLAFLAAALVLSAPLAAQTPPAPQPDMERELRENYAQTATLQMQAYRVELDAAVKAAPADRERYTPVYALIKRGEELIVRLRSAPRTEVEAVKAMFQANRAEIDRALGRDGASAG